jgi:hypothetical protein
LDPARLPPWLYDAAKGDGAAMGWLAAGYLAGIAVGKRTGPCMAVLDIAPGLVIPTTCELHHGHVGGHSNGQGTKWSDAPITLQPAVQSSAPEPPS